MKGDVCPVRDIESAFSVIDISNKSKKDDWNQTGIKSRVVDEIRQFAKEYGMRSVILFGSRARGNYRRESDIDLAVSGGDADLFHLAVEASTLLQYDVVNLDLHLQPGLREVIEQEGKIIYVKV